MPIRLEIDEGFVVEFEDDTVTIGTDPACNIPYPPGGGIAPKHAVIRRIAGRWIIEAREADSIQVGDDAPTRMHWLTGGDVIRLTDAGPVITFEPAATATKTLPPLRDSAPSAATEKPRSIPGALPKSPRAVPKSPEPDAPRPSKPKSHKLPSLDDAIELEVWNEDDDDESTKPVPTPNPKLIPKLNPKSKPARSAAMADTDAEDQKQVPAVQQVPTVRPLPPLMTSQSWGNESTSGAAKARHRRAQRGFWLQVAGAGVLAAIAIAVWQLGGTGSNTKTPVDSQPDTVQTSGATSNQLASTDPMTDSHPADGGRTDHTKPQSGRPDRVNDPDKSPDTSMTGDSQTGKDSVKPGGVKPEKPVTIAKPTDDPQKPTPETVPSGPDRPRPVEPPASATLVAVRDGVFAVIAKHPDGEHHFRLGTAWAASRRHLVTSGAIAMAVGELQREGLTIVVSHPHDGRPDEHPIVIRAARVHPAYLSAVERAATAREQLAASATNPPAPNKNKKDREVIPPREELARALANQARFDLGVLDIALGERLSSPLTLDAGDLPDVSKSEFTLVGFPFAEADYQADSADVAGEAHERQCPKGEAEKSDSTLALTMTFTDDVAVDNWSGSPVFDQSRRVIGVYSRSSKSEEGRGPKLLPRHAVIWLGRLREFAPEFE
jgi:hypothetical protein